MPTDPYPLPPIRPSLLFTAALKALGTGGTPHSSREARRVAYAELFAVFRDEGDDDVPFIDEWEVRDLEEALHPVMAHAMNTAKRRAVRVDWDGLIKIVPAEHARLALFMHGIYPLPHDGRTIWDAIWPMQASLPHGFRSVICGGPAGSS